MFVFCSISAVSESKQRPHRRRRRPLITHCLGDYDQVGVARQKRGENPGKFTHPDPDRAASSCESPIGGVAGAEQGKRARLPRPPQ